MEYHNVLKKYEKAQSIVETAIVLPLILLIIFGIIEFGRLFNYKLTLNYAVNEGGKVAAQRLPPEDIKNTIKQAITGFTIKDSNINITYQDKNGNNVSYTISNNEKIYFETTEEVFCSIIINYDFTPIVPYPVITENGVLTLNEKAYVKVQ